MNNKIYVNINYLSNFNPNFFKNFNKFKNKNKKKIICRNFFLFLFLLNYLNNFLICKNIKLFIKPKKKNFINVLRAPYKNKLSKHQIGLFRYFINFKLIIYINIYTFITYNDFFIFLKKFKLFFKFFETNITHSYKIIIFYNFNLKNFFLF